MKSHILKLVVLSCLAGLVSCDVTFKRKSVDTNTLPVNTEIVNEGKSNRVKNNVAFDRKDSHIISSYYADKSNAIIRKDMIRQTKLSKEQNINLVIGSIIPRDVQVMPLPLKLERILSALSLQFLRVQAGEKLILMNVKSRKILDIIKI